MTTVMELTTERSVLLPTWSYASASSSASSTSSCSRCFASVVRTVFCLATLLALLAAASSLGLFPATKAPRPPHLSAPTQHASTQQPQQERHHAGRRDLQIYGGSDASTSEYGFAVSLTHRGRHVCTGSLISPGVVLTAAHCFAAATTVHSRGPGGTFFTTKAVAPGTFHVTLGKSPAAPTTLTTLTTRTTEEASSPPLPTTMGVVRVVIGDGFAYSRGTPEWDIALVFLDACADPAKHPSIKLLVDAAGLAGAPEDPSDPTAFFRPGGKVDAPARIAGWGESTGVCMKYSHVPSNSNNHGKDAMSMREAYKEEHLRALDPFASMQEMRYGIAACDAATFCPFDALECDDRRMLCLQQRAAATCDGDSGAPLFFRHRPHLPTHTTHTTHTTTQEGKEGKEGEEGEEGEEGDRVEYLQIGVLSGGHIKRDDASRRGG